MHGFASTDTSSIGRGSTPTGSSRRRSSGRIKRGRPHGGSSTRTWSAWRAPPRRRSVTVEVSRSRRRRAGVENGDGTQTPFEPIQQLRAHEYVAEQIRRHIALRLIRPGESLPSERELASMFGVGRPTIQHAMRVLEADHLVEARRGRGGGTFVREPAEDAGAMEELVARVLRQGEELEELLGWRRALEPVVAREAARTRRRSDLAAIRGTIREMERA